MAPCTRRLNRCVCRRCGALTRPARPATTRGRSKPASLEGARARPVHRQGNRGSDDIAPDLSSVVPATSAHFEIVDVYDAPGEVPRRRDKPHGTARPDARSCSTVAGTKTPFRKDFAEAVSDGDCRRRSCSRAECRPSASRARTAEEARARVVFVERTCSTAPCVRCGQTDTRAYLLNPLHQAHHRLQDVDARSRDVEECAGRVATLQDWGAPARSAPVPDVRRKRLPELVDVRQAALRGVPLQLRRADVFGKCSSTASTSTQRHRQAMGETQQALLRCLTRCSVTTSTKTLVATPR